MRLRALSIALACVAAASSVTVADAQTPPHPPIPQRPPIMPPFGNARPAQDDCAITAMNVFVQARRTAAMVDVGVRVRGVKGGGCRVLPETVQLSSLRGGNVARPMSMRFIDGQPQRPISMAESPAGEKLGAWAGFLRPNEEKQVVLRFYLEGLEQSDGGVDPAGRVTVRLRDLGARVYTGAPLNIKVAFEAGSRGRAQLTTGNAKSPPATRTTGADGSVTFSSTLSKDDLLPQLEWRYEGDPPAAADASKLSGGLAVFEYLRHGLAQDFAAGLLSADTGDDKKKDKKDDKAAAAWDQAFDAALGASRSTDPVVAGMGIRWFSWLASGLSPAVARVHAPGGNATPDSVEVPDKIASLIGRAADGFTAATGQRMAPSVVNSIFSRAVVTKLGEPGSRKKEADEAIKRLVTRIDENKSAVAVGNFFSTAPAIALAPGVKAAGARVIAWDRRGNAYLVSSGPSVMPRPPLVQRVVRGLTHLRGMRFLVGVSALGALVAAGWLFYQSRRDNQLASATPT